MHPQFIITRNGDLFNYLFVDGQADILLSGNLCPSVKACLKAVAEVRDVAMHSGCYQKIKVHDGQYSFVLHDKKGNVVGHGSSWWSVSSRDCAITLLRREVGEAAVEDRSRENIAAVV